MRVLAHVRRYRITTQQAVQRLFYPEGDDEAVKARIHRLRRAGLITSSPLTHRMNYYQLAPRAAAAVFGELAEKQRPPGVQSIADLYTILSFCCLGPQHFERYTTQEFEQAFPDLVSAGLPSRFYYRDANPDRERIGFLLPAINTDYRRVLRKCRHIFRRRYEMAAWRRLIEEDGFAIAIVVPRPEKAVRIREALEAQPDPIALKFWRLEVRDDLRQLPTLRSERP